MAADFRINLAKDITSSEEGRTRFYNGMLIYLVLCSAVLVFVAFFTSTNIQTFLKNRDERAMLLRRVAMQEGFDISAFKNPDKIYDELEAHAANIAALKKVLSQRVQLLPVIHNLFVDLPEGVVLQSLSANKSEMAFGLVMPPPAEQSRDPVQQLRAAWEKNEELMKRVATIRPVTGERRTMGSKSVFYVQFECILKK